MCISHLNYFIFSFVCSLVFFSLSFRLLFLLFTLNYCRGPIRSTRCGSVYCCISRFWSKWIIDKKKCLIASDVCSVQMTRGDFIIVAERHSMWMGSIIESNANDEHKSETERERERASERATDWLTEGEREREAKQKSHQKLQQQRERKIGNKIMLCVLRAKFILKIKRKHKTQFRRRLLLLFHIVVNSQSLSISVARIAEDERKKKFS